MIKGCPRMRTFIHFARPFSMHPILFELAGVARVDVGPLA